MATFRLLNIIDFSLESFTLADSPPYIAASHTWSENVFDSQRPFVSTFGGRGLRTVINRLYPDVRHCWIDTLCIDQNDERDKIAQIPLMGQIFGRAIAVLIFISTELGTTQSDVNTLGAKLEGALAMCKAEAWTEEGAKWQSGAGRKLIVQSMHGLRRLASTSWATRVWTLQEYVLAKKVVWIGLELEPLQFDDYILSALPDVCNSLNITECLGDDMRVLYGYFQGMANARLGSNEHTRIMELLGNRQATVPVDEVYGVMAASRVEIEVVLGETKLQVWERWCEQAIRRGHMRWLLLPKGLASPADKIPGSCVLPCFAERHRLSASSGLDHVDPLGPVSVENGNVTVYARCIGQVRVIRRLGRVYQAQNGRLHRDITLILFSRARWSLALQLVSAFGGGRYDYKQAKSLARVLTCSYVRAIEAITRGKEEDFRPIFDNLYDLRIWNDFMSLQQSQMIGLNEGEGFLCQVTNDLSSFLVVLVTGGEVLAEKAMALDFEARSPDGRFILMIARGWDEKALDLHKVGMTLPVSDDLSGLWAHIRLRQYSIGGDKCMICHRQTDPVSLRRSATASTDGQSRYSKRGAVGKHLTLLKRDQRLLWSLSGSNSRRAAAKLRSSLRRRKLDVLTNLIKKRIRKLRKDI